ncbi:MAG: hypothetical protein ACK5SX_14575 [Sandaracinobacter sp.]
MRLFARLLGLGLAAALLLAGWGYWGATRTPQVIRQSVQLKGLPPGTRLRVLLFSDTHFGRPDMPAARLDAIVDQANALKPDLILLAGTTMAASSCRSPARPIWNPQSPPSPASRHRWASSP